MLAGFVQIVLGKLFDKVETLNKNVDKYDRAIPEPVLSLSTTAVYLCLILFACVFVFPFSALVPSTAVLLKMLM